MIFSPRRPACRERAGRQPGIDKRRPVPQLFKDAGVANRWRHAIAGIPVVDVWLARREPVPTSRTPTVTVTPGPGSRREPAPHAARGHNPVTGIVEAQPLG